MLKNEMANLGYTWLNTVKKQTKQQQQPINNHQVISVNPLFD